MQPLRAIANALGFKKKVFDPMAGLDLNKIGWHKMDGSGVHNTLDFYHSNQYDNSYPSINKIANAFLLIEPYGVKADGSKTSHNILDRLYTPNTRMSAPDFREALAVMTAVHAKVHIRVHYKNGRIQKDGKSYIAPQNVTGFSFVENVVPILRDGIWKYQLANGEWLDEGEVIQLKNINPYNLNDGYSPSEASRKWTTLDDYIATYQAGFFRNGAIPSGQFIITAPTVTDFNDIVDGLMANHSGAGRNNSATYVHRPMDSAGKAQNAQIEWVPFNQENNNLGMKELFDQANKKIDSAYGVPASIRGVNDQNTYASVRVDEVIFAKYVVAPIALKIWSKFTHELNRITGGMGFALSYDHEIPQIADEELVKAQAKAVEVQSITLLLAQGYSIENIVSGLQLPAHYLELEVIDTEDDEADNDVKEVREAGENNDTPDPQEKTKQVNPNIQRDYEERVKGIVRRYTQKIVEDAIDKLEGTKSSKAITDKDIEKFVDNLSTVLVPLMYLEGAQQTSAGMNILFEAGIVPAIQPTFTMTNDQLADYRKLLKKVGKSYTETVQLGIRQVLDRSREQNLSKAQIADQLREFMSEEWRIERIARTEVARGATKSSVYAMSNIQAETGHKISKVWTHTNPSDTGCQFCTAMLGTSIGVDEVFIPEGGQLLGVNDGILTNDFAPIEGGQLHPNCHCYTTYKVQR